MEACSSHESFGAESLLSLAPPDLPTWCCLYAHAVSFGHLPLTPRGARCEETENKVEDV